MPFFKTMRVGCCGWKAGNAGIGTLFQEVHGAGEPGAALLVPAELCAEAKAAPASRAMAAVYASRRRISGLLDGWPTQRESRGPRDCHLANLLANAFPWPGYPPRASAAASPRTRSSRKCDFWR